MTRSVKLTFAVALCSLALSACTTTTSQVRGGAYYTHGSVGTGVYVSPKYPHRLYDPHYRSWHHPHWPYRYHRWHHRPHWQHRPHWERRHDPRVRPIRPAPPVRPATPIQRDRPHQARNRQPIP